MDAQPGGRQSTRLTNFDYTSAGAYFITICAHQRALLFGAIKDEQSVCSAIGVIITDCWNSIPQHFSHVTVDAFVLMPNHIHGILFVNGHRTVNVGAQHAAPLQRQIVVQPGSIGAIVRSLKSAVTKAVNEQGLARGTPIWQRNYHERVIRNDAELNRIRQYIADNPMNWAMDRDNPTVTALPRPL